MDNTVEVSNQKRNQYKTLAVVTLAVCVCFIVAIVFACGIATTNFDGQVATIEGTIVRLEASEGEEESDCPYLVLEDGTRLDTGSIDSIVDWHDWQPYVGKTATFVVPLHQFGSGNQPWLLGMVVDGQTVIDSNVTIAINRQENTIISSVVGALAGLLLAMAVVCIVKVKRSPKNISVELSQIMRDMLCHQQPICKQGKTVSLVTAGLLIAGTILTFVALLLGENEWVKENVAIALAATGFGLWIASLVTVCVMVRWKTKKEIEFYAQNYPFDFTDLGNAPLRKSVKERLQQEAKAERDKYPDRYWEYGNDVWANFAADGVYLVDEEEEYTLDANEIFGDGTEQDEVPGVQTGRYTYAECNFVAVPVYGKRAYPLFVVIKSRLIDDGRLRMDIHLALDSNLLATLGKYNVPVEGLDNILDNKRQLMLDNCPKAKDATINLPANIR